VHCCHLLLHAGKMAINWDLGIPWVALVIVWLNSITVLNRSFFFSWRQLKRYKSKETKSRGMADVQFLGTGIHSVVVRLFSCCGQAHYQNRVNRIGYSVFSCLIFFNGDGACNISLGVRQSQLPTLGRAFENTNPSTPKKRWDCFPLVIGRTDFLMDKLAIQCAHFCWGLFMIHPPLISC
jgi:hypothetical protein